MGQAPTDLSGQAPDVLCALLGVPFIAGGAPEEGEQGNGQEQDSGQQPPNDDADQEPDEPFDKDRAQRTITKLRGFEKTAKAQAKELEELRARVQENENAKLSETERLQNRIKELEEKATGLERERRETVVRSALAAAAAKAGAIYPDAVVKLIDPDGVEITDDGHAKNLDAVLAPLKQQFPAMFRAANGSADGGSRTTGTADPGPGVNRLRHYYATASRSR